MEEKLEKEEINKESFEYFEKVKEVNKESKK